MSALAESAYPLESPRPHSAWSEIDVAAPELAATMRRYLERLGETVVPYSVIVSRRIRRTRSGRI